MSSSYETLGVSQDATAAEIKKAFRRRARAAHPDRGGDAEEFARIQAAYDDLRDPVSRVFYDHAIARERAASSQTPHTPPAAPRAHKAHPARTPSTVTQASTPQWGTSRYYPGGIPASEHLTYAQRTHPSNSHKRTRRRAAVPFGPTGWAGVLLWWPFSFALAVLAFVSMGKALSGGASPTGLAAVGVLEVLAVSASLRLAYLVTSDMAERRK